jgi:hypothetical protein
MMRVHLLRGLDRLPRKPSLQVCREIERELGLRPIALEDLFDWLDAREGLIENLRPYSPRCRLGAHGGQPELKGGRKRLDRGERRRLLRGPRDGSHENREQNGSKAPHRFIVAVALPLRRVYLTRGPR